MKKINGDLLTFALNGDFDVIVHGCNCFHTMGAGIAWQIQKKFPEAYAADKRTPYADRFKLGTFSEAEIKSKNSDFTIVNAYTQFGYSGSHEVDYRAIKAVFEKIKTKFHGQRIAYPKIGAGLAGGDWDVISKIIDIALEGEDHTLVIYDNK